MFPKKNRFQLRKTLPYFTFEHKLHQPSFSLHWRFRSGESDPQAAVIVSKKVAPTSVQRNRLKRVVRATLTPLFPQLSPKLQLVVVVRRQNLEQSVEDFKKTVLETFSKSK